MAKIYKKKSGEDPVQMSKNYVDDDDDNDGEPLMVIST